MRILQPSNNNRETGNTKKNKSFSMKSIIKSGTNSIKDKFNQLTGKTQKHEKAVTGFRNNCDNINNNILKNQPTYANQEILARSLCDIQTSKLEEKDFNELSVTYLNFAKTQIEDFIQQQNKNLEQGVQSHAGGSNKDSLVEDEKNLKLATKALEEIEKIKNNQNIDIQQDYLMASADPRQLDGLTPTGSPTGGVAYTDPAARVRLDDVLDDFYWNMPPAQAEIFPATQPNDDIRTQAGESPRSNITTPTTEELPQYDQLPQMIKKGNIDELKSRTNHFNFDVNDITKDVLQVINADDLKKILSELPERSDNNQLSILEDNKTLYIELSKISYMIKDKIDDISPELLKVIKKDANNKFFKFEPKKRQDEAKEKFAKFSQRGDLNVGSQSLQENGIRQTDSILKQRILEGVRHKDRKKASEPKMNPIEGGTTGLLKESGETKIL